MKFNVHVKCPYCGHENYTLIDEIHYRPVVIVCDNETGGCDRPFAINVRFEPQVEVWKLVKVDESV